tara:strand:- start:555 stop:1601 length:1047 start_codon:yes stop_codon:yes gene_type:complete
MFSLGGVTVLTDNYSAFTRINVEGRVTGVGHTGVRALGRPVSGYISREIRPILTIGANGSITGTYAVLVGSDPTNGRSTVIATIDNAGMLTGSSDLDRRADRARRVAFGDFERSLKIDRTRVEEGLAPASLLRRRPDIAVAEAQLYAANAKIGVQTAGLFPDVSLTGIVELLTGNLSKLILTDSIQAVEQGQVSFPILDFGRSKTLVGQAKASADESYLTCQRTVLVAMNDTETALSQVATARRARDTEAAIVENAASALQSAQAAHDSGLTNLAPSCNAASRIARQRPAWCRQRRRCAWPLFPCSRHWACRHAIWADGEYANRSPLTSALRLIVTRPDGKEPVIDVI